MSPSWQTFIAILGIISPVAIVAAVVKFFTSLGAAKKGMETLITTVQQMDVKLDTHSKGMVSLDKRITKIAAVLNERTGHGHDNDLDSSNGNGSY